MKPLLRDRRVKRFAIVAMLTLAAAPVHAFSAPADYLAEYKLYNEALARGDQAAAVAHSLAAWKAAEESLGDHKTTAVLAYNYGQEVVFNDAAAALPAFERARALQDAGVADLPREDLAMFFAYSTFRAKGERPSHAKALRRALEARDEAGIAPTAESANIWLTLATNDITNERYKEALTSAEREEASADAVETRNLRTKAQAILLQGLAALLPVTREIRDIRKAHDHILRARAMFPPQQGIDRFDIQLAQIMAWDAAAHAALRSTDESAIRTGSKSLFPEEENLQLFEGPNPTDEECKIEWDKRKPPAYPPNALRKGYLGAAIVGYRLGNDDRVHDARILAEVPSEVFGAIALKSTEEWRLAAPAEMLPGCRENRITHFNFFIN